MKKHNQRLARGRFAVLLSLLVITTTISCSSKANRYLDDARFALDHCDPSAASTTDSCQTAVDKANLVLADDPTNVDAAILASSGYMGLAGLDFLQFASELSDVQDNPEADLKQFQQLIDTVETENNRSIDTSYIRSAASVLETALVDLAGDTDLNKRAFFQLGVTQTIENYVIPSKIVSFTDVGQADPTAVTDAIAETLRQNFLDSDNNITAGGTTDTQTLSAMREGYCRCTLSDFGYNSACVRDLMRCELSDTDPSGVEQDYDGNGTCGTSTLSGIKSNGTACTSHGGGTADCEALRNPTGIETCKTEDTE